MSVKIFNAYKINVSSVAGLRDFAKALSNEYFWDRYKKYVEDAATAVSVLSEYAPYLKHMDPLRYEKMTKETARLSTTTPLDKQPTASKSRKMLSQKPLFTIAQYATRNEWAEMDKSQDCENPVKSEIIAFPCPMAIKKQEPNNPTLIIAYGKGLEEFLDRKYRASRLGFDPSDMAYKYSLRDWHYQDQSDKPFGISNDEWKLRSDSWEEAMPSNDARKDGLTVSILDITTFSDWLAGPMYDYEYDGNRNAYNNSAKSASKLDANMIKALGGPENMAKRLTKYAEAEALDEYVETMRRKDDDQKHMSQPAIYSKLKREFDETKNDPGSIAYELIKTRKAAISKYMIDFSKIDPLAMYGLIT